MFLLSRLILPFISGLLSSTIIPSRHTDTEASTAASIDSHTAPSFPIFSFHPPVLHDIKRRNATGLGSSVDTTSNSGCPLQGFSACGGGLPSDFCCSTGTACIVTSGDSALSSALSSESNLFLANTTAICCPEGYSCITIAAIPCDLQALNATASPTSPIFSTDLDGPLTPCDSANSTNVCCPPGYACEAKLCQMTASQVFFAVQPTGTTYSTPTPTTSTTSTSKPTTTASTSSTKTSTTSGAADTSTNKLSSAAAAASSSSALAWRRTTIALAVVLSLAFAAVLCTFAWLQRARLRRIWHRMTNKREDGDDEEWVFWSMLGEVRKWLCPPTYSSSSSSSWSLSSSSSSQFLPHSWSHNDKALRTASKLSKARRSRRLSLRSLYNRSRNLPQSLTIPLSTPMPAPSNGHLLADPPSDYLYASNPLMPVSELPAQAPRMAASSAATVATRPESTSSSSLWPRPLKIVRQQAEDDLLDSQQQCGRSVNIAADGRSSEWRTKKLPPPPPSRLQQQAQQKTQPKPRQKSRLSWQRTPSPAELPATPVLSPSLVKGDGVIIIANDVNDTEKTEKSDDESRPSSPFSPVSIDSPLIIQQAQLQRVTKLQRMQNVVKVVRPPTPTPELEIIRSQARRPAFARRGPADEV